MNFPGFSIPDGAFLPPEIIYLLPHMNGSQLKVLIAILYHAGQIGGSEQLSLSDVENLTGLSRQSVITAIQFLLDEGVIERQEVGSSFTYAPVVKFLDYPEPTSLKIRLVQKLDHPDESLRESERELNNLNLNDSLSDSLNSPENGLKIRLLRELRSCGVYLKTAQAIVAQHDEATIRKHLEYYRHALSKNLAQGPGWLVLSIKENWPSPLGYKSPEEERRRYSEWEE